MYEDLKEYRGEKTRCDNPGCKREFTEGEVITVAQRHTFCFTGEKGGCLIAYIFSMGEFYCGNTQAMRFRGSKWRVPENPTPNYPNMPVVHKEHGVEDEKKAEQENWLRKVLGGLGL